MLHSISFVLVGGLRLGLPMSLVGLGPIISNNPTIKTVCPLLIATRILLLFSGLFRAKFLDVLHFFRSIFTITLLFIYIIKIVLNNLMQSGLSIHESQMYKTQVQKHSAKPPPRKMASAVKISKDEHLYCTITSLPCR